MKFGIFGSKYDAQCQALCTILEKKGAKAITLESQGLNEGQDTSDYNDKSLEDVKCWYLRYIMSPLPPAFEMGDQYYLYSDWFTEYMRRRERHGFQLAWLLGLSLSGIPAVNSPEHGSVIQLKPFQLQAARSVGLEIPKTLISNNPEKVRAFIEEVGKVVYKPTMGGSLCQKVDQEALSNLHLIAASPVIFQNQVEGVSVRLTIIGDELVSAVSIPSTTCDYRQDPQYADGKQVYEQISVPDELIKQCLKLMRSCGLVFSGIDFIRQKDGSFVFLEANSSPIYLDIEQKTSTPITAKLAEYMFTIANEPKWYQKRQLEAARTKSFLNYAYPFNPAKTIATNK